MGKSEVIVIKLWSYSYHRGQANLKCFLLVYLLANYLTFLIRDIMKYGGNIFIYPFFLEKYIAVREMWNIIQLFILKSKHQKPALFNAVPWSDARN